jgi:hypothetical protein
MDDVLAWRLFEGVIIFVLVYIEAFTRLSRNEYILISHTLTLKYPIPI